MTPCDAHRAAPDANSRGGELTELLTEHLQQSVLTLNGFSPHPVA